MSFIEASSKQLNEPPMHTFVKLITRNHTDKDGLCGRWHQFLSLHILPLDEACTYGRNATHGNWYHKRLLQSCHIGLEHTWQIFWAHNLSQMCSTRVDNSASRNIGCIFWQVAYEAIGENILGNRDGERTTERIEEQGDSIASRHVFLVENHLNSNKWDLDTCTCTQTRKKLIADPSSSGGRDFESVYQSRADGEDRTTHYHKGFVDADNSNYSSNNNGRKDIGGKVGDRSNSGAFRRGILNGLEVKRNVKDVCIQTHRQEA